MRDSGENVEPLAALTVLQLRAELLYKDVCDVVKELVDNALDAATASLKVMLPSEDLSELCVTDDGEGVPCAELAFLTRGQSRKSCASEVLAGFRGEALLCLSTVGELHITSRARNCADAWRVTYIDGACVAKRKVAAACGTTVEVEKLFLRHARRAVRTLRAVKREQARLVDALQHFACLNPATAFALKRKVAGKLVQQTVFSEPPRATYGERCGALFPQLRLENEVRDAQFPWGCVLFFGVARYSANVSIVEINRCQREWAELTKQLNTAFEAHSSPSAASKYFALLKLRVHSALFDKNADPKKKSFFLSDEASVVNDILKLLFSAFSPKLSQSALPSRGSVSQATPRLGADETQACARLATQWKENASVNLAEWHFIGSCDLRELFLGHAKLIVSVDATELVRFLFRKLARKAQLREARAVQRPQGCDELCCESAFMELRGSLLSAVPQFYYAADASLFQKLLEQAAPGCSSEQLLFAYAAAQAARDKNHALTALVWEAFAQSVVNSKLPLRVKASPPIRDILRAFERC